MLISLSIIAVHGLNGHARRTWQDPESEKLWLEDFLPDVLPNSRIMTFGYDSAFGFSRNRQGVGSFAKDLLNRLRMMRAELEVSCGHEFNGVERTSLLTFFSLFFSLRKGP